MSTEKKIKLHIKQNDTVAVLAGDSKGRTGKVVSIDTENYRAIVEGLNMVTKHTKPTAGNPQSGGISKKEAPIHLSNLQLVEPGTNKPTRTGRRANAKGKLQRYSKATNEFIPDGKPQTKK